MRLPSALGLFPLVVIGFALALAVDVRHVYAQRWVDEMPEPERVIQDIHGSDDIDTAARQYSALFFLARTVEFVFLGREIPVAASAKLQGYRRAEASVFQRMHFDPNCKAPDCPVRQYLRLVSRYDNNPQFEEEIRSRYFSQQWRKEYAEAVRRPIPASAPPRRQGQKDALWSLKVIGWSFVFGIACIVTFFGWIRARRKIRTLEVYEFEHRTGAGVITFNTYDDSKRHYRQKGVWALVWLVSVIAWPLSGFAALALAFLGFAKLIE